MALKDVILGSHIWFAREGSTVNSLAVVSTTLPVFASTKADWLQLGSVEQFEPRKTQTNVERRAPITNGGRYELRKKIPLQSKLLLAFGVQEFNMINFEMLFGANEPSSGVFTPNSRRELITGWLHLDAYDQENDKIINLDAWCELDQEPFQFGENLNPHALVAEVLGNTLNSGIFTNI